MLHEDFAEIYKITSKTPYKKAYFGNQCFRIFTACCYTKSINNNDVRNDNVIVVTESSDHDRVASISCLQKVIHKIKHMHKKRTRMFMFGVMEWSHNSYLAIYSNY